MDARSVGQRAALMDARWVGLKAASMAMMLADGMAHV